MPNRCILHSDANCFYASVEMLLNPELRGKAVAVCGSTEDRHGIVPARSEKANARIKRQNLETCVDDIRRRFGKRSIFAASLMGDLHMPGDGRHEVTMPGMMYT